MRRAAGLGSEIEIYSKALGASSYAARVGSLSSFQMGAILALSRDQGGLAGDRKNGNVKESLANESVRGKFRPGKVCIDWQKT